MTRRTYILVLYKNRATDIADDIKPIVDHLDPGDSGFAFDNNVAFLNTAQDVATLTKYLNAGPLSNMQFFLADITNADRAGNMFPVIWDFLHKKDELSPVD